MDLYGSSSDFRIDDLLDFSNDDIFSSSSSSSADTSSFDYCHNHSPMISPTATTATAAAVSANPSFFTSDLSFPSDNDVAELEWLSQFVGDDVDTAANDMSFYGGVSAGSAGVFSNEASFPARSARSKRSPRPASDANSTAGWIPEKSSPSSSRPKRSPSEESPTAARRCTHCLSEKTPQWRSGPMGPKTLCNACGVRFKSGRLVPEYRPAASPTFVLTQHSNSHRKVMELRRQKEIMSRGQQSQQPPEQQGQFYSNHQHHHPHHQHGFRVC